MVMQSEAEQAYLGLLKVLPKAEEQRLIKAGTARKASEAFAYITSGYSDTLEEIGQDGLFASNSDDTVALRQLALHSTCEHHLLAFFGHCHIAYLPDGRLLALSRIHRLVKLYSQRLQLQEQLTAQIADGLMQLCSARAVAVVVEARHLCMELRHNGSCGATAKSIALRGDEHSARQLLVSLSGAA